MRYAVIMCLLIVFALPASAQETGKTGLSYTTLGARKERPANTHMYYRRLEYGDSELQYQGTLKPAGAAKALDKNAKKAEELPPEEAAADAVWNKYKALAAGTYEEPEPEEELQDDEKPSKKMVKPAEEAPASGLAGILEQYNRNKAGRAHMRTISISPSEKLKEPEAPTNDALKKKKSQDAEEKE